MSPIVTPDNLDSNSPVTEGNTSRKMRSALIIALGALLLASCASPRTPPEAIEATRAGAHRQTIEAQTPVPVKDTPTPIEINWKQNLGRCLSSCGFLGVQIITGPKISYIVPKDTLATIVRLDKLSKIPLEEPLTGEPSVTFTGTDPDGNTGEFVVYTVEHRSDAWQVFHMSDCKILATPVPND